LLKPKTSTDSPAALSVAPTFTRGSRSADADT
jgi:hypothetical protein